MRVKRFVATNIQEAMVRVKFEFGNEAVILHTRSFKEGGFLGFFSKEYVEVTAAVEEKLTNNSTKLTNNISNIKNEAKNNSENIIPLNSKESYETVEEKKQVSNDSHELTFALNEMRHIMEQMKNNLEFIRKPQTFPKLGQTIYDYLESHEIDSKTAQRIVNKILDKVDINSNISLDEAKKILLSEIVKGLKEPKPIFNNNSSQCRLVALVGPTGVGKTTTIAKLAANFSILNNKKIAFITVDTYRIAAVEQLKAVGDIIGVEVNVVFTPSSLKEKITELKASNCDYIFIDTAGRSHKSAMHMAELKAFVDVIDTEDIFLVLSSTTKYKDMLAIIEQYSSMDINKIIFTKLDETSTYGPIFNIIKNNKKFLSYVTNGQNIPDDIEIADPQKIAKMIVEGL